VLHPSPAESFGLAVLEAMAAGRAVVAFDSDGPRLLIDSGVDGILVPTGDAAAMTAATLELLADPQRRADIGARATTASANYSVERMIAKLAAVWDEVGSTAPRHVS
jgi:glycosyltransferase involved in cell wall biosynthesis